jgi:hypothetical protein
MARKPNYRYERAERERRKAERQAIRDQRKAELRGDAGSAVDPARDSTDVAANSGENDSGPRDG